jgi:hypothetical protein
MSLVSILEAGRRDFLEAVAEIDPQKAGDRPQHEGWSALESIEHVVTVENRYLEWLEQGEEILPQRDSEKELRLLSIMRSRLTKLETPDPMRPQGRYLDLAASLTAFQTVRDRSVSIARERGEALYRIGARHPFFGPVNGVELINMIDGHARRHADQIRETCT